LSVIPDHRAVRDDVSLCQSAFLMTTLQLKFTHTVTERFLRYAVIDTQSDPASPSCPSTEKQKDLDRRQ
jgi:hypothetical protein